MVLLEKISNIQFIESWRLETQDSKINGLFVNGFEVCHIAVRLVLAIKHGKRDNEKGEREGEGESVFERQASILDYFMYDYDANLRSLKFSIFIHSLSAYESFEGSTVKEHFK